MKILNIALISTALAFSPAAMAQVAGTPTETTDEQAPETTEEGEAEDAAPETSAPESN